MLSTVALPGSILLFISFSCHPANATAIQDSFDEPLKEQVETLGPSPYYPNGRYQERLHCYFYSNLLVKEYDEGQKGAEWLSFTHHPLFATHRSLSAIIKVRLGHVPND